MSNNGPVSTLEAYVRLSLGLPDPGAQYDDALAQMAVQAGLRLDGFTVSQGLKTEAVVQEREQARQQQRERTPSQEQARERAAGPGLGKR